MRRIGVIILAMGMSGLLSGCSISVFMVAALSMAAAAWVVWLWRFRRRTNAFLNLSDPDAALCLLADGLNQCADRTVADGRPIWLRLSIAPGVFSAASRCRLTLDKHGTPLLECDGARAVPLASPRRWIADHPVPFAFPAEGTCIVTFLPAGGRVRVAAGVPALRWPLSVWFSLFAVALISCFASLPGLGAATVGVAAAWMFCRFSDANA